MASRFFRGVCAMAALAAVAACSGTKETGSGARSAEAGAVPPDQQAAATAPVPGPVPGTAQDLQANIGDRVFFDKGSTMLGPEGITTLERQAQWLARHPEVTVTLEGHCDERGTRDYNLALGERRAYAVKKILMALGVDPRRLTTISYGKERPAVLGSEESAWAQNRRVVTVVN